MARIRTVKPELWTDDKAADLSCEALLLFIGSWNFCDDQGFMEASARTLKMRVLPERSIDAVAVCCELFAAGVFEEWEDAEGKVWWRVANFEKHQKISNPAAPRVTGAHRRGAPNPPDGSRLLASPSEDSRELANTLSGKERKGVEGKGEQTAREAREHVKKDSPPERVVYERWIAHPQLTQHRRFTDEMRRKAKAALRDRTLDEVCQAVDLYATVLRSERHYWSHQWTLSEFLQRGVEKFAADAQPLTRYLTRDDTNGHPPPAAAIPPRVVALNERRAVSVDEAINRARSAS